MKDYQAIDVHMHAFPTKEAAQLAAVLTGYDDYDGTPKDILRALKAGDISKGVMVIQIPVAYMMEAALSSLPEGISEEGRKKAEEEQRLKMIDRIQRRNVWVCDVAKENPSLIPLITLDPVMGPELMQQEIRNMVTKHGAKGVKLHPPIGRFYPNDPCMWPAYETCVELDIPILFHCGPHPHFDGKSLTPRPVLYSRPKYYEDIYDKFPTLKVQLAHMGVAPDHRFPELYQPFCEEAIALAKKCPSIFYDTCQWLEPRWGPGTILDLIDMIREIGAHRVMYGSDSPAFDPVQHVQWLRESKLTEREKQLVLGENAMWFYKLA